MFGASLQPRDGLPSANHSSSTHSYEAAVQASDFRIICSNELVKNVEALTWSL